jgi:hypothetical protein
VRYVRDTLHGFRERPHYEPVELDGMFEKIVVDFLKKKYGKMEGFRWVGSRNPLNFLNCRTPPLGTTTSPGTVVGLPLIRRHREHRRPTLGGGQGADPAHNGPQGRGPTPAARNVGIFDGIRAFHA